MKVSNKCDYACKAVLDISMNGNSDTVVSVSDISRRQRIPLKYLEHILALLKKNNIVQSRRGQSGGYLLTRSPEDISLADIVLTIDGPVRPIDCYGEDAEHCQDSASCPFQDIWKEIEQSQLAILRRISFSELAQKKQEKEKCGMMYHI